MQCHGLWCMYVLEQQHFYIAECNLAYAWQFLQDQINLLYLWHYSTASATPREVILYYQNSCVQCSIACVQWICIIRIAVSCYILHCTHAATLLKHGDHFSLKLILLRKMYTMQVGISDCLLHCHDQAVFGCDYVGQKLFGTSMACPVFTIPCCFTMYGNSTVLFSTTCSQLCLSFSLYLMQILVL